MQAAEQLRRRGKPLVAALPEDTTGVLMALCTGRYLSVAHSLASLLARELVVIDCTKRRNKEAGATGVKTYLWLIGL